MSEHEDGGVDRKYDPLWQEVTMLVARADPLPPEVARRGRSSLTWRTIDAELAELAYDSVGALPVGVRGSAGPRQLTFEAPGLTLELQLVAAGDRRRLLGFLEPAQEASIMVRHGGGIVAARTDRSGRFVVEDLAAGPATLRCHLAGRGGNRPVVTDWVNL
jgi:hypothetical protein